MTARDLFKVVENLIFEEFKRKIINNLHGLEKQNNKEGLSEEEKIIKDIIE